ncbi:MAG TPA: hypothetical protein VG096_17435 [Bryobacteraceae bacterium]|jgi:hypothetical protein|nr:hypothetical protein [Bryobacteraceae bacterium]
MSTQRQIEANRLNAQKSTGPRTPEGKAVSSQNALKSGLDADSQFVIGESGDEFAAFQHQYIVRFQPMTPEERFQVDTLIRNEWMLRRFFRAEAHLWEYHVIRADRSEGVSLGAALMAADQVFRRLQRRITLAERSYKDAFAELERLQRGRGSLPTPPDGQQPKPVTADSPQLGSFLAPTSGARTSAPPQPFRVASVAVTPPPRIDATSVSPGYFGDLA